MEKLADDLVVGAEAAAAFIGTNQRTVYRLTESNQLPVIRKGRRLYFRKSELERAFRADVA